MIFLKKGIAKPKTKITLNINKNNIQQVTVFKYLGVYLDHKLNWVEHIQCLQRKLSQFTGVFIKSEVLFLQREDSCEAIIF